MSMSLTMPGTARWVFPCPWQRQRLSRSFAHAGRDDGGWPGATSSHSTADAYAFHLNTTNTARFSACSDLTLVETFYLRVYIHTWP